MSFRLTQNRRQMNRIGIVLLAALAIIACVFSAWQFSRNTINSIQQSFADEQTLMFSDMVSKSSDALLRTPPDIASAIQSLEYTHGYYPSGTKQTAGSFLDKVVERSRTNAEQRIAEMLRSTTNFDLRELPVWAIQDE